ncbi:MAG: biotin/lipoyl-binding protein [Deltaproteobacteria bacterium]|nr:biotin/lipoyl-binding protein [Deltaproteobacteria bacterium]
MATAWLTQEDVIGGLPREQRVEILEDNGDTVVALVDGERVALALHDLADGRIEVRSEGQRRLIRARDLGGEILLVEGGEQRRYTITDERARWLRGAGGAGGAGGGEIRASMPGRVVRLPVAVGDVVEAGSVVAVLEAMKMENDVKAPVGGKVAEIAVAEGDAVEQKALLLRIDTDA